MKDINKIWKNYQNIRIIPRILGNGIFILYSKGPNFLVRSATPWYHSNSHSSFGFGLIWINLNLLSGSGKHWRALKGINRTWKVYQNIGTTPAVMRNGTVILLYSRAPKHPASSDAPQYKSQSQNFVSGTGKH